MDTVIRKATKEDASSLLEIYRSVAADPGGIIRQPHEIHQAFIEEVLHKSLHHGLMLVAVEHEQILGEIHAYTPSIYAFQHIFTDLTIVVRPEAQGQGIGKKLFTHFLQLLKEQYLHILRVELFVREHNQRNVAFYERLGFVNEGRQDRKIFVSKGNFETPLHMAWFNPAYEG